LARWIFTSDVHQRIRLKQAALANLLLVACVLLMQLGAARGVIVSRWVLAWTVLSLGGMAVVFAIIRSGVARQWRDPSLAMAQMLYAIACAAGAYVVAGPFRSAVLPMIAVILMFGMFGLSMPQVLGIALYTVLLWLAMAAYWVQREGGTPQAWLREEVNVGMLLVVLSGVCVLTARVAGMRARSKRQQAALEQALEQNRLLATQDELTGCMNRRAMTERLGRAVALATRLRTPCSVIMIDLDHFKQVNDRYGHAAGDEVLRTVAELTGAQLREVDTLARWGGEEFLILLPGATAPDAMICAERLQARLAQARFPTISTDLRLSFSAGIAAIGDGERVATLIERADKAMYQAKQAGRARVVPAEE
jgi:diguanylate cyclase (GGDEF)-like protein